MVLILLDYDFAAVEPLPTGVVEVVLRDDDRQDGHAGVLRNDFCCLLKISLMINKNYHQFASLNRD